MPGTATIPRELAKGHARVSSEGHAGLHEFLVSLHADLLEVKAKFEAHVHGGGPAVDAPNNVITVGTQVEPNKPTLNPAPFNLPGTNGV